MSLILPKNFKYDIIGKNTSLIPVLMIGNHANNYQGVGDVNSSWKNVMPDQVYLISTGQYRIPVKVYQQVDGWNEPDYVEEYDKIATTLPLLKDIPGLRESINIDTRSFKASDIRIILSNYEFHGERFSDIVAKPPRISSHDKETIYNITCRLFYVSPTSEVIPFYHDNYAYTIEDDHALLLYRGRINRYTHDDKQVVLSIEDESMAKLGKTLPLATSTTGDKENVPKQYINKPFPICYGFVQKSPCVISEFARNETFEEGWQTDAITSFTIDMDTKLIEGGVPKRIFPSTPDGTGFLYIYIEPFYYRVPYGYEGHSLFGYGAWQIDPHQGDIDYPKIYMRSRFQGDSVGFQSSTNQLSDDVIEVDIGRIPKSATPFLMPTTEQETTSNFPGDQDSTFNTAHDYPKFDEEVFAENPQGVPQNILWSHDNNPNTMLESDWYYCKGMIGGNNSGSQLDIRGLGFRFNLEPLDIDGEVKTTDTGILKVKTWLLLNYSISIQNITANQYGLGNTWLATYLKGETQRYVFQSFYNDGDTANDSIDTISRGNLYSTAVDGTYGGNQPPMHYASIPLHDIDNGGHKWSSPDYMPHIDVYQVNAWVNQGDIYDTHLRWGLSGVSLYQRMLLTAPVTRKYFADIKGRATITQGSWYVKDFAPYADTVEVYFPGLKLSGDYYSDYQDPDQVEGTPNLQLTSPSIDTNSHAKSNLSIDVGVHLNNKLNCHQGICTDGNYIYTFDSQSWDGFEQVRIDKYTKDFSQKIAFCGNIVPRSQDSEWGDFSDSQDENAPFGNNNHPLLQGSHQGINAMGDGDQYGGRLFLICTNWRHSSYNYPDGAAGAPDNWTISSPDLKVVDANSMHLIGTAHCHGVYTNRMDANYGYGMGPNNSDEGFEFDEGDNNWSGYGHGHNVACVPERGVFLLSLRNNTPGSDGNHFGMYDLTQLMGDTIPQVAPWVGQLKCYDNHLDGFETEWDPDVTDTLIPVAGESYESMGIAVFPGSAQYNQGITTKGDYLYALSNDSEIYTFYIDWENSRAIFMNKHSADYMGNTTAAEEGLDFFNGPIYSIDNPDLPITTQNADGQDMGQDSLWIGTLRDTGNGSTGSQSEIRMWGIEAGVLGGSQNIYNNSYVETSGMITKPSDIIYHLLGEELNAKTLSTETQQSSITGGLTTSRNNHSSWELAFTLHESKKARKTLEEIMQCSKSFVKYRSDGSYDFITLIDFNNKSEHDVLIRNSEIIKLKFEKTPIEEVKTRINVSYHKDYGNDEFVEILDPLSIEDVFSEYKMSYYHLSSNHKDTEATYETEYIRTEGVAKQWQSFLLSWYCQQHLLIFVDLPIKYLNLEVGDIVCFDVASKPHPYGIDYASEDYMSINGSQIFPQCLVYETNKKLDKLSIKCIMMHKINNPPLATRQVGPPSINIHDMIDVTADPSHLDPIESVNLIHKVRSR